MATLSATTSSQALHPHELRLDITSLPLSTQNPGSGGRLANPLTPTAGGRLADPLTYSAQTHSVLKTALRTLKAVSTFHTDPLNVDNANMARIFQEMYNDAHTRLIEQRQRIEALKNGIRPLNEACKEKKAKADEAAKSWWLGRNVKRLIPYSVGIASFGTFGTSVLSCIANPANLTIGVVAFSVFAGFMAFGNEIIKNKGDSAAELKKDAEDELAKAEAEKEKLEADKQKLEYEQVGILCEYLKALNDFQQIQTSVQEQGECTRRFENCVRRHSELGQIPSDSPQESFFPKRDKLISLLIDDLPQEHPIKVQAHRLFDFAGKRSSSPLNMSQSPTEALDKEKNFAIVKEHHATTSSSPELPPRAFSVGGSGGVGGAIDQQFAEQWAALASMIPGTPPEELSLMNYTLSSKGVLVSKSPEPLVVVPRRSRQSIKMAQESPRKAEESPPKQDGQTVTIKLPPTILENPHEQT